MKISIITTTYNGSQYIKETIESVLQQSYIDFEYIIIDDCSSDNTLKVINSFDDKRIKIYKNKNNIGIVGSRNKGLSLVQGKYICFLDQDDIWFSTEKLLKQIDIMEKKSDVGMVGSYCICFENDKDIEWLRFGVSDKEIRKKILIYNQFATCSVMFRKDIVDKIGNLDTKYEKVDDYDFRLRIGEIAQFINIPEFLVKYRYHTHNTTRKSNNLKDMRLMSIQLIKKFKNIYPNAKIGILLQYFLIYFPVDLFAKTRRMLLRQ